MIEYKTVEDYLLEDGYDDHESLIGLILDIVNDVADVEVLKAAIKEYGEHNK